MSHDDSMLWMLEHHIQSALTIIAINMKHDILDKETGYYFLMQKAKNSEVVWEEEVMKIIQREAKVVILLLLILLCITPTAVHYQLIHKKRMMKILIWGYHAFMSRVL